MNDRSDQQSILIPPADQQKDWLGEGNRGRLARARKIHLKALFELQASQLLLHSVVSSKRRTIAHLIASFCTLCTAHIKPWSWL